MRVAGAKARVLPLVVAFLLGAGALALIALVAGLWDQGSNPVILNTERVERAIETAILQQRHLRASVSCPVNIVQRQGVVFLCQATVGGRNFPVTVTQVDGKGHVTFAVV
ncbi:MAG: DUF4333 domain-containing protein [Solirubrobacterales bacterium]|nr:DUF4333 domain-containing protein [Solirubrobacterales bacterium]